MNQDQERVELIGCAIGAAVVTLIADGEIINRDNIVSKLRQQGEALGDGVGSTICHEALNIVMRGL